METEDMTRERLEAYRSNRDEIKELKYKLDHLGEGDSLIGNDVIFDYKKGYPMPQTVVGYDYELEWKRRERYENQIAKLKVEQDNIEEWVFGIRDSRTRRIFQMYFLEGLTQEKVARKMNIERSGVSKKIDAFLKVSHKSQKSHL
mgnify:CR=1 FL=1